MKKNKIIILILSILITLSCNKAQKDEENNILIAYITDIEKVLNRTIIPQSSGLYYIKLKSVAGSDLLTTPIAGDTLSLSYKGYILPDTTNAFVEKSLDIYVFKKDNVIEGWEEGISLMKKGEDAKIVIPSKLAYGKVQTAVIPPYSILMFNVTMVDKKP